jgi:hypothetical protein
MVPPSCPARPHPGAVSRCFTPEVAQALPSLRTDADTQARIEELADKSMAGQLSADERAEYETYVSAIDFLGRPAGQSPA